MRKRISLKTRRPDLSRWQFRNHYEDRHVPLGLAFIDRFRWRRYVRNHVLSSTGAPIGFDCYAEFWVDDDFEDASLDQFIRSADFRVLDEDDRRFLDITQRHSFDVIETVMKQAQYEVRTEGKVAINWSAGANPKESVVSIAERIVDSLGDRVVDAILGTRSGVVPPAAPFDTMLSLQIADAKPVVLDSAVEPGEGWSVIAVDPVETPIELLFGDSSHLPDERKRTCCP